MMRGFNWHPHRRKAFRDAAANWWEAGGATGAVGVYQPKGAASLAASYVNLANPGTNDAAPGVAPTWASGTGWSFNGSTQYLTTGLVPASGYSMICQYDGLSGASIEVLCGIASTVDDARFWIMPRHTADLHIWGYGDAINTTATRSASGVMALAGTNGYLDGVLDGPAGTWNSTVLDIYIGGNNSDTGILNTIGGNISALAVYNTTLTGPQVAAITTAMQAL